MVRLNLSLDDIGNCEETTAFIKKRVLNLAYIHGHSLQKSKDQGKFNSSKTRKSARKASKTRSGNTFLIGLML